MRGFGEKAGWEDMREWVVVRLLREILHLITIRYFPKARLSFRQFSFHSFHELRPLNF